MPSDFEIRVSIASSLRIIKLKIIAHRCTQAHTKCKNAPRAVKKCVQAIYWKISYVLSVKLKKFGVANNAKES
jgi:hypothetical protein